MAAPIAPVTLARVVPRPESLHPALRLCHQLGRHADAVVPSGFPALDAQLPGHGWPRRAAGGALVRVYRSRRPVAPPTPNWFLQGRFG